MVEALEFGDPTAYLPWLRFFPMKNVVKLKEAIAIRDKFMQEKLKEHMETINPDHVRDFTDSLIKTSRDEEAFKSIRTAQKRSAENLDLLLSDLIVAGNLLNLSIFPWK